MKYLSAAFAAIGLALWAAPAHADPVGDALRSKFGSTDANVENVKDLMHKGVTFDLTAGLWYANLNGGLSSLANSWATATNSATPTDRAARSIGTGTGFVREIGININVAGNEAYFDYLSDELVNTAQEEASKQVDNPLAKRIIRKLIGELRPDLKSIFGESSQVYIRGEYGKLQGDIENSTVFGSRNGKPYFGGHSEGWATDYFGFEAGWYPDGRHRVADPGDSFAFGFFARYRNFQRPLALGFSPEDANARFFLADGVVTTYELGVKAEVATCGKTFCFLAEGSLVPATAYVRLDLDKYGDVGTALLAVGGRVEASMPLKITNTIFIGPYLGFRAELLQPLSFSFAQDFTDDNSINKVEIWSPDYFFWGPTAGIQGRL